MMYPRTTALFFLGVVFPVANAKVFGFKDAAEMVLGLKTEVTPAPPEEMLVIGAGLGRTGTTSFVDAMRRLGLKTYHMIEGVIDHGHAPLWEEMAMQYTKDGTVDAAKIIDQMAVDGFNATSDFPACLIYKELFERYPTARVVLTVRGGSGGSSAGAAWANSGLETVWKLTALSQRLPLNWVPEFFSIGRINYLFSLPRIGAHPPNPETNLPEADALAVAYDEWIERVKEDIPTDRLLVYKAQHGWKPLCDFLSPVAPAIKKNCDEILASNEPYPFSNDKSKLKAVVFALTSLVNLFKCIPFFLAIGGYIYQRNKQQGYGSITKNPSKKL